MLLVQSLLFVLPFAAEPVHRSLAAMSQPGTPPIVASCCHQDTRVQGAVLSSQSNRPIANAEVVVGTRSIRTDSAGRFTLSVTAGRQQFIVRAVGFEEISEMLDIPASGIEDAEITMEPITELQRVETRADPLANSPNLRGFEERRRMGLGRFIDSTVLNPMGDTRQWASVILTRVPGLRLMAYGGRRAFAVGRGAISVNLVPSGDATDRLLGAPGACYVQIIIDGILRYGSRLNESLFDANFAGGEKIIAAEYYTVSQLPAEFNRGGNAPCGALVLWTQR
ncbi:MAG TPA: carboxypeptidase-like regulatory domain-containing protein [Gemmatimonas sp.]|uniref:carboxypeptidase-like regulatory domain-containing protein n=1 Tax=Gemmatimonas sp. TaxID=1962908 RepID=UPI002ED96C92